MNILDYIPKGKENAIKGRKLATMLNVDERTVRNMVMQARNNGAVILNNGNNDNGYFIPVLPDDLECVYKEYDIVMGRAYAAQCAAENLRQVMELYPL